MQTSLKTGVAQIFSCCPKNLSCPKFGGAAAPLAPLARTPMLSGVMKCNVKLKVKLFVNRMVFIRSMHLRVIIFTLRI